MSEYSDLHDDDHPTYAFGSIDRIVCTACKGFRRNPTWSVVCGYCCGTGRLPIPNEEVFPNLRPRR